VKSRIQGNNQEDASTAGAQEHNITLVEGREDTTHPFVGPPAPGFTKMIIRLFIMNAQNINSRNPLSSASLCNKAE
jgi:hypothetical protein